MGVGLGLALCATIVADSGGWIWAESAGENLGSSFFFTVPLLTPRELAEYRTDALKGDDAVLVPRLEGRLDEGQPSANDSADRESQTRVPAASSCGAARRDAAEAGARIPRAQTFAGYFARVPGTVQASKGHDEDERKLAGAAPHQQSVLPTSTSAEAAAWERLLATDSASTDEVDALLKVAGGLNWVLTVDDDSVNTMVLGLLLGSCTAWKVVAVDSGEAAIEEIAKRGLPDAILLDVMMPGVDGLTTSRRLRELYGRAAVYIALVSANTGDNDVRAGFAAGADAYVSKPFKRAEIHEQLRAAVRFRVRERRLQRTAVNDHAGLAAAIAVPAAAQDTAVQGEAFVALHGD